MAFIYPMFQTTVSNTALLKAHVYERGDGRGWISEKVELNETDNPVKLELIGMFLPGSPYIGNAVPFKVKITGLEGVVFDEMVELYPNIQSSSSDGSVNISTYAPQFTVSRSGSYTIDVGMEEKPDFSLSSVFAIVHSSVIGPDTTFRIPAIFVMLLGLFFFFTIGKSKRKPKSVSADAQPQTKAPKPVEKPKKKKIQWGRNADRD